MIVNIILYCALVLYSGTGFGKVSKGSSMAHEKIESVHYFRGCEPSSKGDPLPERQSWPVLYDLKFDLIHHVALLNSSDDKNSYRLKLTANDVDRIEKWIASRNQQNWKSPYPDSNSPALESDYVTVVSQAPSKSTGKLAVSQNKSLVFDSHTVASPFKKASEYQSKLKTTEASRFFPVLSRELIERWKKTSAEHPAKFKNIVYFKGYQPASQANDFFNQRPKSSPVDRSFEWPGFSAFFDGYKVSTAVWENGRTLPDRTLIPTTEQIDKMVNFVTHAATIENKYVHQMEEGGIFEVEQINFDYEPPEYGTLISSKTVYFQIQPAKQPNRSTPQSVLKTTDVTRFFEGWLKELKPL